MKTKLQNLVALLVCAIFAVVTIVILQITGSCTPPPRNHHKEIYHDFGIKIPEEWAVLYYNPGSRGGWDAGGVAYIVFRVSERDETFFENFQSSKNQEFESYVTSEQGFIFKGAHEIAEEYLFDFSQSYEWYNMRNEQFWVGAIYQSQRLYLFLAGSNELQ